MAGFNTKEGKKSNKTRGLKLVYDFDPVSMQYILSINIYFTVNNTY